MESNDYIEFEGVRRYQPDALHKRMLQRIAELEAAQQWQPVTDNPLIVDSVDDTVRVKVNGRGEQFKVTWTGFDYRENGTLDFVTVDLPDNIRLCRKIQPAA